MTNATPIFNLSADQLQFKQPRSLISRMIAGSLSNYMNELYAEGNDEAHLQKQGRFMLECHKKHGTASNATFKILSEAIHDFYQSAKSGNS